MFFYLCTGVTYAGGSAKRASAEFYELASLEGRPLPHHRPNPNKELSIMAMIHPRLSQLDLSPLNQRHVKPSAIESMADVAAHGL